MSQIRRGLPPGAKLRRVLSATRERAMYNFHYEVDMEADIEPRRVIVRVALCAQEWQDRDVPDGVRYQLLWRALAASRRRAGVHRGPWRPLRRGSGSSPS